VKVKCTEPSFERTIVKEFPTTDVLRVPQYAGKSISFAEIFFRMSSSSELKEDSIINYIETGIFSRRKGSYSVIYFLL